MEKIENENKLTFELNVKIGIKDYRLKYISRKGWIIAAILIASKIGLWLTRASP